MSYIHVPQLVIVVDPDGDKTTYKTKDDWGWVPSSPLVIAPPETKTSYIDLPGYSIRYDYTEALQGSVPYGARTGQWTFYKSNPLRDPIAAEADHQDIINKIHGKYVKVYIDPSGAVDTSKTTALTYTGRLSVDDWEPSTYPDPRSVNITIGYELNGEAVSETV